MPPTFSIFNNTTIVILVDGNFNIVRGNFRHLDRSTTIRNTTDPFNNVLERTVAAGQPLLPNTPLGEYFSFGFLKLLEVDLVQRTAPNFSVSPNTSAELPDHDTDRDRPSSIPGNTYH